MIAAAHTHSFSRRILLGHEQTLDILHSALEQEGFQILCEVPFHREFQKSIGVSCRKYTVLVVWRPFETYRAVLTEDDAGLLVPFNVVVAEEDQATLVAVNRRFEICRCKLALGLALLLRDVEIRMQRVIAALELVTH